MAGKEGKTHRNTIRRAKENALISKVGPDAQKDLREYELIRTEILQYLEEYQTVRNMMYLVTATILSLNGAFWEEPYVFLIPLVVILPSYMVLYDYWKCVTIDSAYLEVFYEQRPDSPYHWEKRRHKFSKRNAKSRSWMPEQQLPYIVCGTLCLFLFFWKKIMTPFLVDGFEAIRCADLMFWLLVALLSLSIFVHCTKVDRAEYIKIWKTIKYQEMGRTMQITQQRM